jgi:hypothetical protein
VYVNGKSKDLVYNVFEHFPQIVGYMGWVFYPLRINAVVPNANDWVRCNNETVKYYFNEHSFVHICIVVVRWLLFLGKSSVATPPNLRDLLNAPHRRLEHVAYFSISHQSANKSVPPWPCLWTCAHWQVDSHHCNRHPYSGIK